jgi:hypothetical protein
MFANAESAIAKIETLQAHAGPPGRRTARPADVLSPAPGPGKPDDR